MWPGTRVENECPPMCISGTTQCAGSADNAAGSYLGSTLLTRTSNASQLFRVALTYTQYFASQLFRVSTLLNIHAGNARAYTVWPYISNCPTLHPMFWKGARDTKKLLGLTSYTYMCVCLSLHLLGWARSFRRFLGPQLGLLFSNLNWFFLFVYEIILAKKWTGWEFSLF